MPKQGKRADKRRTKRIIRPQKDKMVKSPEVAKGDGNIRPTPWGNK